MILHAQTRRSLSWAGCLVVGGLGLFLVSVVPVQAQAPDPFQKPAAVAQKESVDQQIEILKKAIMILEQQKAANKAKASPKQPDAAELKKAEEDVAAIAKEMEIKQGELKALAQKYAIALDRLAKLKGGKVSNNQPYEKFYFQWKKEAPSHKALLNVYPDTVKEKKAAETLLYDVIKKKAPPESLEQKLDRLMREVEELRREIKQQKSPKGTFIPAQPSAIFTVPATPPVNVTVPATPTIAPAPNSQPPVTSAPAAPAKN